MPRVRSRAAAVALAAGAGVLWFTSAPTFDLWILAWIAMVPAMAAIESARTVRGAFLYGWVAGLTTNLGGFYWLAGTFTRFVDAPWPLAAIALVAICAWQALIFAGFGAVVWWIRRRSALPMTLVAPAAMVTVEFLVPTLFPCNLAITQAWQTHLIQIADLTGPLGITALLLMINGAVYDVLDGGRRRAMAAAAAVVVLVAALVYGDVRIRQIDARRAAAPAIRVGIVQPNVAFDATGPQRPAAAQLRDLHIQSRGLEAEGADVIVWPESAYPYLVPGDAERDPEIRRRLLLRRGFSRPLIFGAITDPSRASAPRSARAHNSLILLDRDGAFAGVYDKIFLVAFSEAMPTRNILPALDRLLPAGAGELDAGRSATMLPLRLADGRDVRIGPMICLEDTLPRHGRLLAAGHPHLLVNATNDVWFGDTTEPWGHLALSVYRAVELRAELVRAVNTGVSAHVDANGRVTAGTSVVDPTVVRRGPERLLVRAALLEGGHTVYAAAGDVLAYAMVVLTLALSAWAWRRGRFVTPLVTGSKMHVHGVEH